MRVDPALWAELERLAATELRSVNAQIEYLLRESLNVRRGQASVSQDIPQKVVKIKRRMGSSA